MSPPAPRMCQPRAGRRIPRNGAGPRWKSPHRYSPSRIKPQTPLADRPRPAVTSGPAAEASALAALAADATGAAVPPVDVAASAAASDDTAPADDSRASNAPLIDAAEGTVLLVAGSAVDISDDVAATADDAGAPPTDAAGFGGCCRCLFGRENIGISISFDWSHSSKAESEITAVGGERVPLGGCSRRWWRACKGGLPLANDAVVSGGPDTLETGPPWQSISTSRCAFPCAILFASPLTGGLLRQAPLCSQPKLQKGRGPCWCCGHSAYRRRRGSVARTVSHDNYDYRCRTAAADPYWYRSRC